MRGADKAAIVDARLFDVFTGAGVPEGEKSLAIEVVLQPGDKSFTEADLTAIAGRIVAAAAKLGARLRGERGSPRSLSLAPKSKAGRMSLDTGDVSGRRRHAPFLSLRWRA